MIRLLLLVIFGFLLYTIVTTLLRLARGGRPLEPEVPPEKSSDGEEMIKDPVCGTYLPRGDAISRQTAEGRVYFCSSECAEQHRKSKS